MKAATAPQTTKLDGFHSEDANGSSGNGHALAERNQISIPHGTSVRSKRKTEDDSLLESLCKIILRNQIGKPPLCAMRRH
jgi:hypothetical protein